MNQMLTTEMVGNKIAEARKKMNISQAQLAQMLFISSQAVGKWERGESMPDITTFNRIAEILGVDLNYFSDSFPSSTPMMESSQNLQNETEEIPVTKKKKKLNWNFSFSNWEDADFSGLNNVHEKFNASNMKKCLFMNSDLSELHLKNNHVNQCDFSESNIKNSRIGWSHIENSKFLKASLNKTQITGTHLEKCDFSEADLSEVTFKLSTFESNIMTNAILNGTSFSASTLENITFEGTIEDCSFENCSFSKVTFKNTTLLNTFIKGTKLKKTQFINCQADKITYAFLKNAKADMTGIEVL